MSMTTAAHRHARRGLTLIEAVVSLVIISVLVLGLSSSVLLGTYAMPSATDLGVADRQVHDICNLIRSDIANAKSVQSQKTGTSLRLTLSMQAHGALGEGTSVIYELIPDANMIRRRVDARNYETLTTELDGYRIAATADNSQLRYVHLQLSFDSTIQKRFELYILTPYRPEVR
ncbi:MAG: prepilin-type N-terminal cleavage/methylation domain-containing protein [Phycisphaerales bacterium]|nr:prepilin-type N-terminal cleavage/methylation domain-containing protein [Phycisphaerales bacterium]